METGFPDPSRLERQDSAGVFGSQDSSSLSSPTSTQALLHFLQFQRFGAPLFSGEMSSVVPGASPDAKGRPITKKTAASPHDGDLGVFRWPVPRPFPFGPSTGGGGPGSALLMPRRECRFCKSNGEPPLNYSSHVLRNSDGKLICPILRRHVCEVCGATGDDAHTRNYCPSRPSWTTRPVQVALKRTRRRSDGLLRN